MKGLTTLVISMSTNLMEMRKNGDAFWAQGLHLKLDQWCSDGIRTAFSSSSTLTES